MKVKTIHYLFKNVVSCGSDAYWAKPVESTTDRDAVTCKKCIRQIEISDDMDRKRGSHNS